MKKFKFLKQPVSLLLALMLLFSAAVSVLVSAAPESVTTYEAQIYPMASGAPITSAYSNTTNPNNNNLVQVLTYENGEPAARAFWNSNPASASESFGMITSNNSNRIFKITPHTTVKVKNIWQTERRGQSGNRPQDYINFVNKRLEFKGIKVYRASNFTHNNPSYSGNPYNNSSSNVNISLIDDATLGAEIPCTKEGDYYVFEMPESGVRIVPEYDHHIRAINILSNQRVLNTWNTYPIGSSQSLGTATLTGDKDNLFITSAWNNMSDTYVTTNYVSTQWATNRILTLDGTFTLTVKPKNHENYYVKSVKAYKPHERSSGNFGSAYNNYVYTSSFNNNDTCNWLKYDSGGDINAKITSTEIEGVIPEKGEEGALSAPAADGTQTCKVNLPSTLDVGNIVLWVEFAPVDHTRFANFQYVKDSTPDAFNPPVVIKGIFEDSDQTSMTATNGASASMAVYDDEPSHIINVEIGGDNTKSSAIYNRSLVYEIRDYTENTVLAKFRIYNNQIIPVDCTAAELSDYLDTANASFTSSGNSGVCTKAVLPFKLPDNGIKLTYTATEPYAPITVKQYAADENNTEVTVDSSYTATVTKYPTTAGADYFTTQDPFIQPASFTGNYTASGASSSVLMKLENSTSEQGFEIRPNAPAGYVLADAPVVRTISPDGTVNTAAGVTVTYVGDNTYRVTYTGDSNHLSYMNGEKIEVVINYKESALNYVPFSYTAAGSFKPRTVFRGEIAGNSSGTAVGTNNLNTINVSAYDENDQTPQYLTMEIGGNNASDSIFHETNLVYTLNERGSGIPLLKFRIYRGVIEPVDSYSQATFNEYIDSANIEGYNTSSEGGMMEKATITLKIPSGGLSMTGYAETPYLPVTVKQYVLNNNGTSSAAGVSFETAVTKYYTGSNDLGLHKYFNKNDVNGDTYGLGSAGADQNDFIDNYTAIGASDTHYMVYLNATQGVYLKPDAPEGYELATIEAKAFNPAGNEITNTTHKQSLTSVPTIYNSNGYQISLSSGNYMRAESIELAVYYRPSTNITIKQEMDGTLEPNTTLAQVTVTNTASVSSPFTSYVDTDNKLVNSVTLTDTSANVNEVDDEHSGSKFRTTKLGVHKDVVPEIRIEPRGARNVSSVRILKKSEGEYAEVPASAYTVDGTGANSSYITYTFNNAVEFGDDYLVEIVYGRQQQLKVQAVMRDVNGTETPINSAESYALSGLNKITVSGQRYNISGSDISDKAFSNVNDTSDDFNSFEITDTPITVNSATNTRVSINTSFNSNSDYVIANIIASNDRGNNLNLVVAGTKSYDGSNETTYESVTMPSLSSSDNVNVKIILTKVASVNVNVFTIADNGDILEGTPRGVNRSDAYVNVSVRNNSVNSKAIITAPDEGHYYTGDFDITYEPHSRSVSVLEGSSLDAFAQLPGNGDYVISKITCDGTGYRNIAISSVSKTSNNYLRESLNTNNTVIRAENNYVLNIYIQRARSIYTRVIKDHGNNSISAGGGTVTMLGSHSDSGVIPFTKIVPTGNSSPTQYNAVNSSNDYTSEAKAIRDTNISFNVTPPSQYSIKSVTVKKGTSKANAQDVAFTSSAPNSNGMVTYTVSEPMSPNDDLFVDVTYGILDGGTVTVDFQYTDDYENYYNLFDSGEKGISTMNVSVGTGGYDTPKQVAKNLVTDEESFSWSGITYSANDIPDTIPEGKYKFYVASGNYFRVKATAFINGKWYVGVEGQCGVYNADTNQLISGDSASTTNGSIPDVSYTMTAGRNLLYKYLLVPAATFGSVAVDNNSYNDNPSNARKENRGSATINATPSAAEEVLHAIGSGFDNRTNSSSASLGDIAKGSAINSVDVNTSVYNPGRIRSVTLYEFDKSVIGGNVVASYESLKNPIANNLYDQKWELTYNGTNNSGNNNESYRYVPESPIQVQSDKSYRVVVMYDKIRVINETTTIDTTTQTYSKAYLYYGSDDTDDINMSMPSSGNYELLGWNTTKSYAVNTIDAKTAVYYVLVADLPREDLSLTSSSFEDYVDGKSNVNITDALNASYTTRYHNGITKYYYIYKINPDDAHPIDNTVRFYSKFTLRTDSPPPAEQTVDCDIQVEQWNRDTYDGNYVPATNQAVRFSVAEDKVLKNGGKSGTQQNPIEITTPTGSMYTNCDVMLTIKPIPDIGYNVERVQISDGSTNNHYPDANGEIKHRTRYSNVTIKIYYSRPLIRISSTNEGNKGKAEVDVYNATTDKTETVLTENNFTNGTFVTKGDNAQVIIKPLTYTDEDLDYYYTVASIRIGDTYNNTITVYNDNGDVAGDAFTVEKMADGSQYRLTMNSVQKDKYIFIQLVGKEKIYTSNLQVNQQIKFAGTNDYVDCSEGNYGSITVNGDLSGNNTPLNFDGNDLASYTFDDTAQIEGTVVSGTTLSLSNIVPPDGGYIVESVEVERNGYSAGVTESNGTYTLNNTAPDSGSTVITVKYGLRRTEFTLNYKYYSREWNADNESNYENNNKVIGNNTQPDKTYTVKVNLTDADIKDGKPISKVLVDNAPSVDDLYKDCKWKFDNNHVTYSGNTVTITPDQPAKTFTVKFFKNSGSENELETISQVKLNNLVKKDGNFIEADEKSGNSSFAYWLVKYADTDKEITKCYSREFNLRVTADIDVVAYYGDKAKSITISDASYSREQTNDGNGNISDKLFADFILSYMEESGKLFNPSFAASDGVETLTGYSSGLLVEFDSTINLVREDEKGHKLTDQEKIVFPANDAVDKDTIISYIKGDNPTIPNTRTLLDLPVNNSSYNNRNRVDKALSFNNTEAARHAVLRAYYYVIDDSGNVELTDPVYFYLYDIGNSDATTEG